jgi:hypothetical protein
MFWEGIYQPWLQILRIKTALEYGTQMKVPNFGRQIKYFYFY